jgi:hypothetical protein
VTEQTYTAAASGALTAVITSPIGEVNVRVDASVRQATVRVHTADAEGQTAEAVRDTHIEEHDGTLRVRVPELPGGGGTVISGNVISDGGVIVSGGNFSSIQSSFGNVSSVQIGGGHFSGGIVAGDGDVIIGGRKIVSGGRVVAEQGTVVSACTGTITVEVVLPTDSSLEVETTNADLTVHGDLNELAFEADNGTLRAAGARTLGAVTHNGDILVARVDEEFGAVSHNGAIRVDAYGGRSGSAQTHNGSISITGTAASTGRLTVRTHNGNITLRGTDHLKTSTKTHRGRIF